MRKPRQHRLITYVIGPMAGLVFIALMILSVSNAFGQEPGTGGAEAPSLNANVYVRVTYGPYGLVEAFAFQYAGDGNWDDCDNCVEALQLTARKGNVVYVGPAAEGKKGAAYRLHLKRRQTMIRGSYYYRSLRTGRSTKHNNSWMGHGRLRERRGRSYLSQVFWSYYDPKVVNAPDGLCDPTKRSCNK